MHDLLVGPSNTLIFDARWNSEVLDFHKDLPTTYCKDSQLWSLLMQIQSAFLKICEMSLQSTIRTAFSCVGESDFLLNAKDFE